VPLQTAPKLKGDNNSMKIINPTTVLLKEKEWKRPKVKKGEPEPPKSNPNVVGEATIIESLDQRLKKGDKVLINRTGILNIEVKGVRYVYLDIEDVIVKL